MCPMDTFLHCFGFKKGSCFVGKWPITVFRGKTTLFMLFFLPLLLLCHILISVKPRIFLLRPAAVLDADYQTRGRGEGWW